ncbi:inactive poly [ADP-ribose] polymerase RCD1-like isoform X2 [Rhodamnia argentea]|uniref:Inactive poly [ADP-ribose] polymerase RCD1-like isoform X2 n=1 Tax=Rhodamnia argentea TaxID=178133 RepID=A0A8B8PG12_9MYRT|nr:inactive poly [ADP-ribose] polymerase RCD1-like isoform X2 [Rhodamnia argentea]
MEARWNKDHGHRVAVKCKPQGAIHEEGQRGTLYPQQVSSNSLVGKIRKRNRLDGCKNECSFWPTESVSKNYTRFMKSSLPQRVLFFQDNEWNDFPTYIVELIRESFELKNAAIEVKSNGCHFLLDILYMSQWDFVTGSQRHIAWIDEAGRRFFPEPYSGATGMQKSSQSELEADAGYSFEIPEGMQEIKLQLDIEINGAHICCMEEGVGESSSHAKKIKTNQIPADCNDDAQDNVKLNKPLDMKLEDIVGIGQLMNKVAETKIATVHQHMNSDTVRDMFVMGMGFPMHSDIIEVNRCSSHSMQSRLELFEKQVEITRNLRGDPNVNYAWLAANKNAVSSIMMYGPGAGGFKRACTYGSGVHLTSVDNTHVSAKFCDDDENGVKYVVLCRVILGSVELVHPGSRQFCPSSNNFDSGVDDLQNPQYYIVWNMNMNTHIFPEFVVSFKIQASAGGHLAGKNCRNELSETAVSKGPVDQATLHHSPVEPGKDDTLVSSSAKNPKSPWMPFPLLFDAISKEVAAKDMNAINANYELFRTKRISRIDFIKRLRSIVGDELLRSSIMSLQGKLALGSSHNAKVPKPEQEV